MVFEAKHLPKAKLRHCISTNFTDAGVEAVVMVDDVVLHVKIKILEDDASTQLVYRDLLGQDIIRRLFGWNSYASRLVVEAVFL